MNNYYTPSGKFSPIALGLFIVLCLSIFPALGALYTYAIWYIPFIYINFLITTAFAFCIGVLIKILVVRIGKVRNFKLVFVLSIIGGFVAIYSHWVVWADLIINSTETIGSGRVSVISSSSNLDQLMFIFWNPKFLLELMKEVNKYATWEIFDFSVEGWLLWIVWLLETIIILIGSVVVGIQGSKNPFCERSNKWFKKTELPPMSFIFSKPDFVQELEQGSDKILATLSLHDVVFDNTSYAKFTVFSSDHDEHYLTAVNMKKMVETNNGEVKYEEDDVIEWISISPQILHLLQSVKKKERTVKNKDSK